MLNIRQLNIYLLIWLLYYIICHRYHLKSKRYISIFSDWSSAIMIILAGTKEEHLNMLEGGIIAKLLDEKWNTFAKVWFWKIMPELPNFKIFLKICLIRLNPAYNYKPISDVFLQKTRKSLHCLLRVSKSLKKGEKSKKYKVVSYFYVQFCSIEIKCM